MSDAQADLLLVLVVGLTAAMAILTVFVLYLAYHPPPERWKPPGRDNRENKDDDEQAK